MKRNILKEIGYILVLTAIYFVAARAGLHLEAKNRFASLVWAPSGIALASLLVFGPRLWVGIFLGAFSVNFSLGAPLLASLGIATGNSLEALTGYFLLTRVAGFQNSMDRVRDIFAFIGFGALLSTTVSATFGISSLYFGGMLGSNELLITWLHWWVGDLVGMLVIGPFLLLNKKWPKMDRPRMLEFSLLGISTILSTWMVLQQNFVIYGFPKPLFAFPVLLWACLRFGKQGAVISTLITTAMIVWGTATHYSPTHAADHIEDQLLRLHLVTVFFGLTGLIFAVVLAESRRAQEAMKRTQKNLVFIKEASNALVSSLEYQVTLKKVADLAVQQGTADWCMIDIVEPEKPATRMEAIRKDVEIEHQVKEFQRKHGDLPVRVHDRSELFSEGSTSTISVAFRTRDRVLGSIFFCSFHHEKLFTSEDLAFAEDLARMSALAMDNARLYTESKSAVQSRDQFLYIASHELKTPLTSLLLQLQLVDKIMVGQGKAKDVLMGAVEQGKRLALLVEELLDLTRIRSGQLALRKEKLDLSNLTKAVANRFGDSPQIHLQLDAPVHGNWDRIRIEQVVTNLISNAVKYGDGKPIDVVVDRGYGKAFATLSVRDHGIGIPAEKLDQIFHMFDRGRISKEVSGLGLGLYITHQIVLAHGGRVAVQSEVKKGSVFVVELPTEELKA